MHWILMTVSLMTTYFWAKFFHAGAVGLSISLFFMRGLWMVLESAKLNQRWVKIVPHVNDTVLLVSAIILSFSAAQYPFVHGWLTAKVILLVLYIGLGMVALTRGKTKQIGIITWIAAMIVFAYMVLIALTKSVNPFILL
jgi:uncharacterized membrane protein SirB2